MRVLALNPGSNSLKFDVVEVTPKQQFGCQGHKLLSGAVDSIGKDPCFLRFDGHRTAGSRPVDARDFHAATSAVFDAFGSSDGASGISLQSMDLVAVRVVHGAGEFDRAALVDERVKVIIERLKKFAPLHNQKSLDVIAGAEHRLSKTPIAVAFDTSFHRTIPEIAWRYPLPPALADQHGIRRYGFHGLSHRYMLERYALAAQRPLTEISIVTLHLESGCSACAIRNGVSVDTSMGVTPLEGLMMGTRSGSVDPSIVQLLVEQAGMTLAQAMEVLNKKSGLLGISGSSLDTRVLMKELGTSERARLAMEMFAYRVRQWVGAYLATLGEAEAVLFGGGIGESTPMVRARVSQGLGGFGLELDPALNKRRLLEEGLISEQNSRLAAWSMPVDEGLQLAWECAQALDGR